MVTAAVKISVVEDDDSMRHAIKALIELAGHSVEDFCSAEDFLTNGRSEDTKCLILDIRLPGMSGLELQSRLAASGLKVPIIFISGHGDGYAQERALQGGAIEFLQKPFSDEALFNAIELAVTFHQSSPADVTDRHWPLCKVELRT
jgi:FixJ family two-component response regulator